MSCPFATLDAAYVLGSLAPEERADYERHLDGCDRCARSVGELAGLPGLLARVPADVVDPAVGREPVPTTLLPALVAAAERQQRRRTARTALLAAAAVALVAVGSAVVVASVDEDERPVSSPPVVETTPSEPQEMTPVHGRSEGWITLTPLASGGTRIELDCTYRSSYSHAYLYRLVVTTEDGRALEVAAFEAVPDDGLTIREDVAVDAGEIAKIEVRNRYGAILRLRPVPTP